MNDSNVDAWAGKLLNPVLKHARHEAKALGIADAEECESRALTVLVTALRALGDDDARPVLPYVKKCVSNDLRDHRKECAQARPREDAQPLGAIELEAWALYRHEGLDADAIAGRLGVGRKVVDNAIKNGEAQEARKQGETGATFNGKSRARALPAQQYAFDDESEVIESLGAQDAGILREIYSYGRSFESVAADLGITAKALECRVYRLKQNCVEKLNSSRNGEGKRPSAECREIDPVSHSTPDHTKIEDVPRGESPSPLYLAG